MREASALLGARVAGGSHEAPRGADRLTGPGHRAGQFLARRYSEKTKPVDNRLCPSWSRTVVQARFEQPPPTMIR